MEWSWRVTSNNACEANEQLIVLTYSENKSDLVISIVACCHRQTFLFNIYQEENDRKVFESSSPAKYKSNCTEVKKKSAEL